MAQTSLAALRRMRDGHPDGVVPRVFIETGTYMASTTRLASKLYDRVESVELSRPLWVRAQQYAAPGVRFWFGRSQDVLPTLLAACAEPITLYLDAHWFRKPDVAGADGFPLWNELALAAARPYADIVVVDDVRSFGSDITQPEWVGVSGETIVKALGRDRVAATAVIDDHFVFFFLKKRQSWQLMIC